MKKLAWVLLACISSQAMAQNVVPGPDIDPACVPQSGANCTQWTPAQWIAAWQSVVSANGGYLTNGQLFGTTVNNGTISGGTISGVSIPSYQPVLGYTPYNATNPAGYQTAAQVASIYAPLASPTFTGSPTVPGYLTTAIAGTTYAPLASPTFTGSPNVTVNLSGSSYASGLTVMGTALGSGVNGPTTAQNGISINMQSPSYPVTGSRAGEIDGLNIYTRQSNPGSDSGGLLINSQCTGLGFCGASEFASTIYNTTTNAITYNMDIQMGDLNVPGNAYYGAVFTAATGAMTAGVLVQDSSSATWGYAYEALHLGAQEFTVDNTTGNLFSNGVGYFQGAVTSAYNAVNAYSASVNQWEYLNYNGTNQWLVGKFNSFGSNYVIWDSVNGGAILNAYPGGAVTISGPTSSSGKGGSPVTIQGQNAPAGNYNGGNVVLIPGAATGTGTLGEVQIAGLLNLQSYTVATLPACWPGTMSTMVSVTDATAPTYNGALTGGGSVKIPVFCNGTAWTAH